IDDFATRKVSHGQVMIERDESDAVETLGETSLHVLGIVEEQNVSARHHFFQTGSHLRHATRIIFENQYSSSHAFQRQTPKNKPQRTANNFTSSLTPPCSSAPAPSLSERRHRYTPAGRRNSASPVACCPCR